MREARRQLERMVDRQSRAGVRPAFDKGMSAVGRAFRERFKGRMRDDLGHAQLHEAGNLLGAGMKHAFGLVGGALADSTKDTLHESARNLQGFVRRASGGRTVLDDDLRLRSVALARQDELERLRRLQGARMAVDASLSIRARLLSMPVGKARVRDAVDAVLEGADAQWYRVERAARTATSDSYNAAQVEGMLILRPEHPELRMRWTEYVSDVTGAPLDKKVGKDSLAMHGQLAKPGALFTMPGDDERAPSVMVGKGWFHPPNRPNDRAVILPWKPGWGIPGWEVRGGQRVPVLR